MDVKKGHSLKYSLFRYLMVAVVVSIVCSYALQSTADQIRENIWIKYIDDTENFYDFQNAYSEEFESGLPIPSVGTNQMERTDKIMVELCDFISSWGIFILTLFSIFVALSLFYSRRLKKPFRILNDCADRIKSRIWILRSYMTEAMRWGGCAGLSNRCAQNWRLTTTGCGI